MSHKRFITLDEFDRIHYTTRIKHLNLRVPDEEIKVQRMMIKTPRASGFSVPPELFWVHPLIEEIIFFNNMPDYYDRFAYITIRNGICNYKTDKEWHVDGFSTRHEIRSDDNFIWSNNYPSQTAMNVMKIPKDFDPAIHDLNKFINNSPNNFWIHELLPRTLYHLDSYVVHRRNPIAQGRKRCFIRVSFVDIPIKDENTINPLISFNQVYPKNTFRDTLTEYKSGEY